MSLDCLTRVWTYSQAKGSALLLMLALADNADNYGFCYPSIQTLAHKTRLSSRQVIRLIEAVESTGELMVIRNGRYNRYVVNIWPEFTPSVGSGKKEYRCQGCGATKYSRVGDTVETFGLFEYRIPDSSSRAWGPEQAVTLCRECLTFYKARSKEIREIPDFPTPNHAATSDILSPITPEEPHSTSDISASIGDVSVTTGDIFSPSSDIAMSLKPFNRINQLNHFNDDNPQAVATVSEAAAPQPVPVSENPSPNENLTSSEDAPLDEWPPPSEPPSATPKRTTAEQKQRTLEALARGINRNAETKEAVYRLFRINPNWNTKNGRLFLQWIAGLPEGHSLDGFARWWYSNDWRGLKGQPPTLAQIQELWPQAYPQKAIALDEIAAKQTDAERGKDFDRRKKEFALAEELQARLTKVGKYLDWMFGKLTDEDMRTYGVYEIASQIKQLPSQQQDAAT